MRKKSKCQTVERHCWFVSEHGFKVADVMYDDDEYKLLGKKLFLFVFFFIYIIVKIQLCPNKSWNR